MGDLSELWFTTQWSLGACNTLTLKINLLIKSRNRSAGQDLCKNNIIFLNFYFFKHDNILLVKFYTLPYFIVDIVFKT